jgi:branched-chain amino acid transport system substrate-binding protein
VVSRLSVPPGTPPSATASIIAAARPDAVFYGGEYPEGGPLSRALAGVGLDVPMMGGDGVVNPGYVDAGGREGDLGTSVGPPPGTLLSARGFVESYRRARYPESFGSYGASTFDAADVLVDSVTRALGRDGTWSPARRPAMVRAVRSYSGDGATGPIAFDRYGDVRTDAVTVFRVQAGRWTVTGPAS